MLLLSVRVNGKDCYNFSEVNHARSYQRLLDSRTRTAKRMIFDF